jgi:hypothetical protein
MMAEANTPGRFPGGGRETDSPPAILGILTTAPKTVRNGAGAPKIYAGLTVECSQNEAADSRDDLVASGAGH